MTASWRHLTHGLLVVAIAGLVGGCAELVAQGQVSDRESSGIVTDVEVLAKPEGGEWKSLGTTDGRGNWWILKSKIPSGARIRLMKRGYHPLEMSQDDFLDTRSILMTPTGAISDPFDPGFEASGDGLD